MCTMCQFVKDRESTGVVTVANPNTEAKEDAGTAMRVRGAMCDTIWRCLLVRYFVIVS